ncbi:hypothetical protein [Actinosynnema sp. NPDC023587]|uniref:hypothetical protein n=1 Tax=Actinosynnema sp. NPDC023587 TaxID=3154695 RepID=UPI0033E8C42B
MAVLSPTELPSDLLDLTSMSLAELRELREPRLDEEIRRAVGRVRAGRFGDSIQGQRD